MSVVVFDGIKLSGDSFLSVGGLVGSIDKVGRCGKGARGFRYGFVGNPGVAQSAVRKLSSLVEEAYLSDNEVLEDFNQWSFDLPPCVSEEPTTVLFIPDAGYSMYIWYAGDAITELPVQPLYIGADEGKSIYAHFLSLPVPEFAEKVVTRCIQASEALEHRFASGPALTV